MLAAVEVGEWHSDRSLPFAVASHAVVADASKIFSIGGKDTTGQPVSQVRVAAIQPDGSLGAWRSVPSLPTPVYVHAAGTYGQNIYVAGGWDGADVRPDIWRATKGFENDLSAWAKAGQMPLGLVLHNVVFADNKLYVIGGWNNNSALNTVYMAAVGSDGSVSGWQQVRSLPQPFYRGAATVFRGVLYVTGGFDGSNVSNLIYFARINADGSLGAWQTKQMPVAREYHQALLHDGQLVLSGGRKDADPGGWDRVDVAHINADGSLGVWQSLPALPRPLYRFGAASVFKNGSDYIFILGGLAAVKTAIGLKSIIRTYHRRQLPARQIRHFRLPPERPRRRLPPRQPHRQLQVQRPSVRLSVYR